MSVIITRILGARREHLTTGIYTRTKILHPLLSSFVVDSVFSGTKFAFFCVQEFFWNVSMNKCCLLIVWLLVFLGWFCVVFGCVFWCIWVFVLVFRIFLLVLVLCWVFVVGWCSGCCFACRDFGVVFCLFLCRCVLCGLMLCVFFGVFQCLLLVLIRGGLSIGRMCRWVVSSILILCFCVLFCSQWMARVRLFVTVLCMGLLVLCLLICFSFKNWKFYENFGRILKSHKIK